VQRKHASLQFSEVHRAQPGRVRIG
jgi:hypothetical protein